MDRQALRQLRAGETQQAVFDYTEAGRVHIGHQRGDTMAVMVDTWWTDTQTVGVEHVRMLAGHRHDVDLLNQLARIRMGESGDLTGPAVETGAGVVLQAGDRIVVRANWYSHGDLRNGQTGTVTTVDPTRGQVTFRRDHDQSDIVLPRRYVDTNVDYGYAQTIHTAQGQTYDKVHVYVDQAMTAEHGYTGLSRARGQTHIWTADIPGPLGDCTHGHCPPAVENRIDTLVRQLTRSGIRPPAADRFPVVQTASDQQLSGWRHDLAHVISNSPLGQAVPDVDGIDAAIFEARAAVTRRGIGDRQVTHLEELRQKHLDLNAARQDWLEDNADLIHQYSAVVVELDRRVAARTRLYRTDPPQDVLDALGPRSKAADTQEWDTAVVVYAKARLEAGPTADLTDPATLNAGAWHDIISELNPTEQHGPVLRLTG